MLPAPSKGTLITSVDSKRTPQYGTDGYSLYRSGTTSRKRIEKRLDIKEVKQPIVDEIRQRVIG